MGEELGVHSPGGTVGAGSSRDNQMVGKPDRAIKPLLQAPKKGKRSSDDGGKEIFRRRRRMRSMTAP